MSTRRGAVAATAALLVMSTAGCDPERTGSAGVPVVEGGATESWQPIAPSPIEPRHASVGVWTGSEMLVAGGSDGFTCPPGADCVGELEDDWRRDGAAYDPATDTWRRIADAPQEFSGGLAAWTGTEMVVVSQGVTLALDPATDVWRELDPPPRTGEGFNQSVVTDEGVVFGSYDSVPTARTAPDWLLDPVAGTWTALPDDGLGESYDRSLAWDGERLWLLSMSVDHHFEAYEGATSRVAVLEDDRWRLVRETPDVVQGQRWWWAEDRLVAPAPTGDVASATYAPDSDEWTPLRLRDPVPLHTDQGCFLGAVGAGPDWVAGPNTPLVSAEPVDSLEVPPCPTVALPDVVVWAGEELIAWGGTSPDYESNVDVGLRWRPRDPG